MYTHLSRLGVLTFVVLALVLVTYAAVPGAAHGDTVLREAANTTVQQGPCSRPMPVPPPDADKRLAITGQLGGASFDAAPIDGHVLLGVGTRVDVVDVNAEGSERVGTTEILGGVVHEIEVVDGLAYVAAGRGGLAVVDVGDPENPTIVARLPDPASAEAVALAGGFAYVADPEALSGRGMLWIIDVTDPHALNAEELLPSAGIVDVAVAAGHLLVARQHDVDIYSLNDPTDPQAVAATTRGRELEGLHVSGGWLYVLDAGKVVTYDISDVQAPRRVTERAFDGQPLDIAVDDSFAYIVGGPERGRPRSPSSGWFSRVDLAELQTESNSTGLPATPSLQVPNQASSVAIADGRAVVAAAFDGLRVFDVSSPDALVEFGRYETLGMAIGAGNLDTVALGLEDGFGLRSLQVDPGGQLQLRDEFRDVDSDAMTVAGDRAYLEHRDAGPRIVAIGGSGRLDSYGALAASEYAASPTHAFMRQNEFPQGLFVYDVTTADRPDEVAHSSTIRDIPIGVGGDYLFMSDWTVVEPPRLKAYAIRDPRRPVEAAAVDLWPRSMAAEALLTASRGFVPVGDLVHVLEIDGAEMRMADGRIPIPGRCQRHGADGTRLWTSGDDITVFDASDPDAPEVIAQLEMPAFAPHVAPKGDRAIVAGGSAGLLVVELVDYEPPTPTPQPTATQTAMPTPPPTPTATAEPTESTGTGSSILLPRLLNQDPSGG